jgi:hypothetical protein
MCDVSGPIVDRCQSLRKVMIRWGKVATLMVCGWFLLESAKDRFLGVNSLDNM